MIDDRILLMAALTRALLHESPEEWRCLMDGSTDAELIAALGVAVRGLATTCVAIDRDDPERGLAQLQAALATAYDPRPESSQ